jgi:hypothetical protein
MARKSISDIRPGDRVTIVDRFGKERSGRAVMRGPHGWVLNMGGKHGTPGIADERNIIKVSAGRKQRGLGSSAATHTTEAARATRDIEYAAANTVNKARNGRCTSAQVAYAEMQQAIGRFDASTHAGGKAWKPQTAITDAAYEFTMRCVRDDAGAAIGRRRRKRSR